MGQRRKEIIVPAPRQVSSGKWYIYLRLSTGTYSITDKDYNRCIARARAIKAGVLEEQQNGDGITLMQAIDKYIESRSAVLSPSTIRGYRIIQRNRFPGLMGQNVYKISRRQLQTAVNKECREVSAKTVKNAYGLISAAIAYETDRQITVTLPQVIPNEHEFLTPEQIPVFLGTVKGTDIELACLLGLWSLRQSEISALTRGDIDFTANTIKVNRAAVPDEHNKMVVKPETKNTSSRRTIPLSPRIKELIPPDLPKDTQLVKIAPASLRRKINKICEENNLPQIGVHGLRHSFASLGYSLGIPEKELMAIGGWSNDATMKKIYTHISKQQKQDAIQKFMEFYTEKGQN